MSETAPIDFQARHAEIAERIEALRKERGAAILDEGQFDSSAIDELEAELEGLSEAEAESRRREYEAERRRVSEDDAVGPGDTLTIEQSFF